MKNYYINLHANGKKELRGWNGFDECKAHFTSEHKPATPEFVKDMTEAIDFYWNQKKRYWLDYAVGKLFVEVGREPVSVMSPAYEYHKGKTFPKYEEVKD